MRGTAMLLASLRHMWIRRLLTGTLLFGAVLWAAIDRVGLWARCPVTSAPPVLRFVRDDSTSP